MELRRRPVSEIMRTEVVSLAPGETLDLTQDIMKLGRVRHMPVLDGGRLVGLVSNRDLLEASLSRTLDFDPTSRRTFLRSIEVAEVMTQQVHSVAPEATLEEVARTLVQRQIGCLPVVGPDGTLLGLVTETDLLAVAFLEGEAGEDPGETVDVSPRSDLVEWIEGELAELRRVRDELKVQSHLARVEVQDRWQVLEQALKGLERRARELSRAVEPPAREIEADVRKLADDLREGYRRIRESL